MPRAREQSPGALGVRQEEQTELREQCPAALVEQPTNRIPLPQGARASAGLLPVLPAQPSPALLLLPPGSPALPHTHRDTQEFGVSEDEHPQVCHTLCCRPGQQLQVAIPVYDSNQESQEGSDHFLDSLPQGVPLGRKTWRNL